MKEYYVHYICMHHDFSEERNQKKKKNILSLPKESTHYEKQKSKGIGTEQVMKH